MEESVSEFTNALAQNKTRIHVWRLENGILNEIADLGTFYTQSVYLVLEVKFQLESKPQNCIYLWCGAFSNPDDESPVNERIQVLFTLLRSSASIHHEYEGYECKKFLKAFIPYGGVRYRIPGLEYVTNRGFSSLFSLVLEPIPHWKEIPASVSSLQVLDVNFMRTRASFTLWLGFESSNIKRLRAAELCGAFRQSVGREDVTKLVYQGTDDRDFIRSLSSSPIDEPRRNEVSTTSEIVREVYQVISSGEELDFHLIAYKNDATLNMCQNDNAYILRDPDGIYVWFGKGQPQDAMAIGLVVAIVFMQKKEIPRNTHIHVTRGDEKFSDNW